MRVTVCEITNNPVQLESDWKALVRHVQENKSELVLLPEMPFYPWIVQTRFPEPQTWKDSVNRHEIWMEQFQALKSSLVTGSFPVIRYGKWLNEAFIYSAWTGYKPVHHKYYLSNEEGFWESLWYERGENDFSVAHYKKTVLGYMISGELWFSQHARSYAKQGIQILLCPRAVPYDPTDKWIAAGRTAAVVSGAFCLSSNFRSDEFDDLPFGGKGWIIEPESGVIMGVTTPENPFLTLDIHIETADRAKKNFPVNIRD